jgi:DNA polymerase IV
MSLHKIIHIDMNACYASVKQPDKPELWGRPVAVGHGEAIPPQADTAPTAAAVGAP